MRIVVDTLFDGDAVLEGGPYSIEVADGRVAAVTELEAGTFGGALHAAFAMPGLVEGHSHLFLNGDEIDPDRRKALLAASFEDKLASARANLQKNLDAGVTLVLDAGDAYGVNLALKRESDASADLPRVRTCGRGIHRPGRYGSMIACAVSSKSEIDAAIADVAARADALKVALTGIVDLKTGGVTGRPQFDAEELSWIVGRARERELLVHVHCSGEEGIAVAARAGVHSIEHGYGMTSDLLARLRDVGVSWTPTLSPFRAIVTGQAGALSQEDVDAVKRIVDAHSKRVREAFAVGVRVVAGSDACAAGVDHGTGLLDELDAMREAGVSAKDALSSATVAFRDAWGLAGARIREGEAAEITILAENPLDDFRALRTPLGVVIGGRFVSLKGADA